jgi:hypothetical protein
MKKFIFGLLVGMALMVTGNVFAADIQSLIGKTIQGQFGVTVDGKSLDMPAIVVDGTSFLPVRSFGESVGYAVYFDTEGAIRLEKQAQLSAGYKAAEQAQWEKDRAASQKQSEDLKVKLTDIEAKIKAENEAVEAQKKKFNDQLESDKMIEAERQKKIDAAKATQPTN